MQLLRESTVLPSEIDSLGHMNVRYYMARMEEANQQLIGSLELPQDTLASSLLRRVDTYTRFRREQFEGARLHTVGGILSLHEGGMQSYIEIRNTETQDAAATFIVTTALVEQGTRKTLPFPVSPKLANQVEIPAHAKPRSLTLSPVNTSITLAELDARIPDIEGGGMMSGKRETTIETTDVDQDGWLSDDKELMFLPFAKMAEQGDVTIGPPVFKTADGTRIGWAVMETRTLQYGQPRLGDVVAYFSADISIEDKSRLSRRWAIDKQTGTVLGISDSVGLCIDLDARKAISWPAEIRAEIEQYQQPDLA